MNKAIDILGGMDAETFLRDYWQKAPLLIRQEKAVVSRLK